MEGRGFFSLQPRQDVLGHPTPHLHRRPGHARQGLAFGGVIVGAQIAHGSDLGIARQGKIGFHDQPAAPIHGAARAVCQQFAQAGGPHPGSPADGGGLQHLQTGQAPQAHPARADVLHLGAEFQIHPRPLQVATRSGGKFGSHGGQHPIHHIHQDHLAELLG